MFYPVTRGLACICVGLVFVSLLPALLEHFSFAAIWLLLHLQPLRLFVSGFIVALLHDTGEWCEVCTISIVFFLFLVSVGQGKLPTAPVHYWFIDAATGHQEQEPFFC